MRARCPRSQGRTPQLHNPFAGYQHFPRQDKARKKQGLATFFQRKKVACTCFFRNRQTTLMVRTLLER
jgi:predicted RNase H-like HicB family nuclease/predicted RNA binding protein YcfA (HicA-like mRNA interferase family)